MPDQVIPVRDLDRAGVILDTPAVSLPPNVFSNVRNMRFNDGAVRKIQGEVDLTSTGISASDTQGTLRYLAYWPNPNRAPLGGYYVYVQDQIIDGLVVGQRVYIQDETGARQDVTPLSLTSGFTSVTSISATSWSHTLFAGGFAFILNNGVEAPHYILDVEGNTDITNVPRLAQLPGWDAYIVRPTVIEGMFNSATDSRLFDLGQLIDFATNNLEVSVTGVDTRTINGNGEANNITTATDSISNTTTLLFTETSLPDNTTLTVRIRSRNSVVVSAGIVRAFSDFLVAGNLTETETRILTSTLLDGEIAAGATTITVDDTSTFPNSGTAFIGANRFTYTGKTMTTFTGVSGIAAAADDSRVELRSVSTTLTDVVSAGATTITVDSTVGFPMSGTAFIGDNRFSYTGTTATTFTGVTGIEAAPVSATVETRDEVVRRLTGVVKTSDVALPGSVPNNWDAFQAGVSTADEFVLSDTAIVQDMAELQGNLYIYTNSSIHSMRLTGNTSVPVSISPVTDQYGIQSTNAVLEYDGKHFVIGSNDIYLFGGHPGNIQSVADSRTRRYFYDNINPIHERKLFCLLNQAFDEIWICYPTLESLGGEANEALLWNYRDNTWSIRDLNSVEGGAVAPIPGGGTPRTAFEVTSFQSTTFNDPITSPLRNINGNFNFGANDPRNRSIALDFTVSDPTMLTDPILMELEVGDEIAVNNSMADGPSTTTDLLNPSNTGSARFNRIYTILDIDTGNRGAIRYFVFPRDNAPMDANDLLPAPPTLGGGFVMGLVIPSSGDSRQLNVGQQEQQSLRIPGPIIGTHQGIPAVYSLAVSNATFTADELDTLDMSFEATAPSSVTQSSTISFPTDNIQIVFRGETERNSVRDLITSSSNRLLTTQAVTLTNTRNNVEGTTTAPRGTTLQTPDANTLIFVGVPRNTLNTGGFASVVTTFSTGSPLAQTPFGSGPNLRNQVNTISFQGAPTLTFNADAVASGGRVRIVYADPTVSPTGGEVNLTLTDLGFTDTDTSIGNTALANAIRTAVGTEGTGSIPALLDWNAGGTDATLMLTSRVAGTREFSSAEVISYPEDTESFPTSDSGFTAGLPVTTTPVGYDGIGFIADAMGQVTATNNRTGLSTTVSDFTFTLQQDLTDQSVPLTWHIPPNNSQTIGDSDFRLGGRYPRLAGTASIVLSDGMVIAPGTNLTSYAVGGTTITQAQVNEIFGTGGQNLTASGNRTSGIGGTWSVTAPWAGGQIYRSAVPGASNNEQSLSWAGQGGLIGRSHVSVTAGNRTWTIDGGSTVDVDDTRVSASLPIQTLTAGQTTSAISLPGITTPPLLSYGGTVIQTNPVAPYSDSGSTSQGVGQVDGVPGLTIAVEGADLTIATAVLGKFADRSNITQPNQTMTVTAGSQGDIRTSSLESNNPTRVGMFRVVNGSQITSTCNPSMSSGGRICNGNLRVRGWGFTRPSDDILDQWTYSAAGTFAEKVFISSATDISNIGSVSGYGVRWRMTAGTDGPNDRVLLVETNVPNGDPITTRTGSLRASHAGEARVIVSSDNRSGSFDPSFNELAGHGSSLTLSNTDTAPRVVTAGTWLNATMGIGADGSDNILENLNTRIVTNTGPFFDSTAYAARNNWTITGTYEAVTGTIVDYDVPSSGIRSATLGNGLYNVDAAGSPPISLRLSGGGLTGNIDIPFGPNETTELGLRDTLFTNLTNGRGTDNPDYPQFNGVDPTLGPNGMVPDQPDGAIYFVSQVETDGVPSIRFHSVVTADHPDFNVTFVTQVDGEDDVREESFFGGNVSDIIRMSIPGTATGTIPPILTTTQDGNILGHSIFYGSHTPQTVANQLRDFLAGTASFQSTTNSADTNGMITGLTQTFTDDGLDAMEVATQNEAPIVTIANSEQDSLVTTGANAFAAPFTRTRLAVATANTPPRFTVTSPEMETVIDITFSDTELTRLGFDPTDTTFKSELGEISAINAAKVLVADFIDRATTQWDTPTVANQATENIIFTDSERRDRVRIQNTRVLYPFVGNNFTITVSPGDTGTLSASIPTNGNISVMTQGRAIKRATPSSIVVEFSGLPAGSNTRTISFGDNDGPVVGINNIAAGIRNSISSDSVVGRRVTVSGRDGNVIVTPNQFGANAVAISAISESNFVAGSIGPATPNTDPNFNPQPIGTGTMRDFGSDMNLLEYRNLGIMSDSIVGIDGLDLERPWSSTQYNPNRFFPIFAQTASAVDTGTGALTLSNRIRAADVGFTFAGSAYVSFVERLVLGMTPEFDTEQLTSVALWADGGTATLRLLVRGTNNPGEVTDLIDTSEANRKLINDFIVGTDYKTDVRIHGRFVNFRLADALVDSDGDIMEGTTGTTVAWNLSGMQFDIMKGGRR